MEYVLYYFLVFITIFQNNIFLENKIGLIGSTFIPLILPFILIFLLLKYKKLKISRPTRVLIKLFIYIIFINLIILFAYLNIFNGSSTILGENVVVKAFKGMIYLPIIICFIVLLENLSRNLTEKRIVKPFYITFIFLFLSLVFEITSPNLFNSIFHDGEFYNRIRLYTSESSFTGPMIMIYGFMSIYYALNYRKKMLPIIFAMIAVFILTSGSKGFIFVALISILLMLIVSNIKIRYKILILSLSIVGGIFILGPIFDSLQNDIQNYTSVSTRMYTIGIAIIMMIKYPFGTGNSLYLKMFPQELDLNLRFMQKTQFNLSEINSYIYATNDKNIGVKSGLLQWGMLWGIPGFIFILIYLNNVRKCILNINNKYRNILIFIFINIIISILIYVGLEVKYEIWLFMSCCVNLKNIKNKS